MPEKEPTPCNRLKVWHEKSVNLSTSCTRLVAWMCLSMVALPLLSRSETESGIMQTPTPIRFDQPDASRQWVTVNDNVMGGRSIGDFTIKEGKLVFRGSTNTNGGGFSSIRSRPLGRDMSAVATALMSRPNGRERMDENPPPLVLVLPRKTSFPSLIVKSPMERPPITLSLTVTH